jgi:hypothetical protein
MVAGEIQLLSGDLPVGIGPVIAGWQGATPVYYVDLVYADGTTRRMVWPKRSKGADRAAKLTAINERMALTRQLRPAVVLTHDEASFAGLVRVIRDLGGHKRERLHVHCANRTDKDPASNRI